MAPRELQDEMQRARPLRITAATSSEASFVGRVQGKFLGVPEVFQRGSKGFPNLFMGSGGFLTQFSKGGFRWLELGLL